MNVLITSVGRCNRLIRDFRQALANSGLVFAGDVSRGAPALCDADHAVLLPACTDPSFIERLLTICKENDVGLLVPRLDCEVALIASARERFIAVGTFPVVSEPRVLAMCEDKLEANRFLANCGLRTPRTWMSLAEAQLALDSGRVSYPVVVKPRFGSTSIGFEEASDERELALVYELAVMRAPRRAPRSMHVMPEESVLIQERLAGDEYGIDVINDLFGHYVTTFVRRKVRMRGGNTDRAVTVDHPALAALGRTLGERLGQLGHVGCLDCDLFLSPDSVPVVIDLNPRIGGGLLFSHVAGANLASALVSWRNGTSPDCGVLAPRADVHVAKFDDFVVVME
jgi:carbamoyl-phosphate synthase large subunit